MSRTIVLELDDADYARLLLQAQSEGRKVEEMALQRLRSPQAFLADARANPAPFGPAQEARDSAYPSYPGFEALRPEVQQVAHALAARHGGEAEVYARVWWETMAPRKRPDPTSQRGAEGEDLVERHFGTRDHGDPHSADKDRIDADPAASPERDAPESPDGEAKVPAAPAASAPGRERPLQLRKRGRSLPRRVRYPPLDIETILAWADAHYARTGAWPTDASGLIPESAGENWSRVNQCLHSGLRGLSPGSSLARLLAKWRGKRNRKALPPLSAAQILAWADAHKERTGVWPTPHSGPILEAPGETWMAAQVALCNGQRGLPGGSSLPQLLQAERGVRNPQKLPRLTVARILAWADAHYERTGKWPTTESGPILEAPGETWMAAQVALCNGQRGLPGGNSLARLLAEHRGVRNRMRLPTLTEEQILAWADAYKERTGRWPMRSSGVVQDMPDERWSALNTCLIQGNRGLQGGSSLAQLLLERRGVRHRLAVPPLSEEQIVLWAESHYARHGSPPHRKSGSVEDAPEEIWIRLDNALAQGHRKLKGGTTLARLLLERHPEWFTPS